MDRLLILDDPGDALAPMVAARCPGLVVEHTAELADALTRAFVRWAQGPVKPG